MSVAQKSIIIKNFLITCPFSFPQGVEQSNNQLGKIESGAQAETLKRG
jgi:hypothetical protein